MPSLISGIATICRIWCIQESEGIAVSQTAAWKKNAEWSVAKIPENIMIEHPDHRTHSQSGKEPDTIEHEYI